MNIFEITESDVNVLEEKINCGEFVDTIDFINEYSNSCSNACASSCSHSCTGHCQGTCQGRSSR